MPEGISTLGAAHQTLAQRLMSRPLQEEPDPESLRIEDERREQGRRARDLDAFYEQVGARYRDCTLENFRTDGDGEIRQRKGNVVAQCRSFAKDLGSHVASGVNVVLAGPVGTGKEHIVFSLTRIAILEFGTRVRWVSGQDLFSEFRDAIGGEKNERSVISAYTKPPLLVLSDPAPARGEATAFNVSVLYRIIDERYRNLRPTWVTINAANKEEAIDAISAPVFDRLLDNGFRLFLNWPSYREKRRLTWDDEQ